MSALSFVWLGLFIIVSGHDADIADLSRRHGNQVQNRNHHSHYNIVVNCRAMRTNLTETTG